MLAASLAASAAHNTSTLNDIEPGVLGFLVVAGIGVALVFLLRSMNKQLRKIGPKPEDTVLLPEDFLARRNEANEAVEAGDDAPAGAVPGEVLTRDDATRRD